VSSSTRSLWRRIINWRLFVALAVVHIVVLPLVLSEREDDVVSVLAGCAYLALAFADWRSRQRFGEVNRS
jgi:hypothetical protein